jgi:hypothetical protein
LDVVASYLALCLAQAVAVALPAAPLRLPRRLEGRVWSLVPPAVIGAIVLAMVVWPALARTMTDLAAVATPLLAVASPVFVARRLRVACGVAALLGLVAAFGLGESLAGQTGRLVLIVLACAPLGRLLASAAPRLALELAIIVTACIDTALVVGGQIGTASQALHDAAPVGGLPRFQDATLGSATLGYGDLFLAALLGAVLASRARTRLRAAVLTGVIGAIYGLLLLHVDIIPATVQVALALVAVEVWDRWRPMLAP